MRDATFDTRRTLSNFSLDSVEKPFDIAIGAFKRPAASGGTVRAVGASTILGYEFHRG